MDFKFGGNGDGVAMICRCERRKKASEKDAQWVYLC